MKSSLEDRFSRMLGRWVGFVGGHAVAVVLLAACGTAVVLSYSASHLGIHGATEQLFAQDLPFKQSERRYQEAFPAQYENLFVVVDAVTPERAGEAAAALLAGMQAEPRYFRTAYLPGGGEFFEEHAFLYLETEELEDLADRLAENQPYLAELSRDGSLRGLTMMVARGVRAVREGDVGGDRVQPMLRHFSEALEVLAADGEYHLSWAEVVAGDRIDRGATRRFLLVQPVLDFNDLQPAKRSILAVRRIAKERGLDATSGVRVRITGDAALSYEELNAVRTQAATAGLFSFVLVALILAFALRSFRLVAATLCTLVVGLVYTAGFTAIAIGHFNLISVAFAVLFIGLGVDFAIHFCIRYREILGPRFGHDEALRRAAHDVGGSITLCAVTTAIGFFAFVPTDFVGVAELGLISGVGMFISLACTLTLLPALMSLSPIPVARPKSAELWNPRSMPQRAPTLSAIPLRYPRAVRGSALALGAAAIFLLPQARFDNNPLNIRDPSSESVRTFNDLLEKGGASPWSLNAIVPNVAAAEAIADELRALDAVGRVVTVENFIPSDQEEKLGIIEDVALFLASPPGTEGESATAPIDAQRASLLQLEREIEKLLADRPPDELGGVARKLRDELHRFTAKLAQSDEPARALRTLETSLVASLPEQMRILTAALGAGRVSLENLPDALLERMITADGRARIQIFPRHSLDDQAAMVEFVEAVRSVTPEVAGSAAEVVESSRAVVRALQQALLSAVVAIALFLLLLWRRINDTALVLFPLGLAATLTVAAAVLLDIPFNFADVIVLPLLLGIGVDSGIHLVHRARISRPGETNLLATSTARAVVYSALTTVASFGTMGFAAHMGLATLGRLLTIGVGFTVLCNLVVLPALIVLHAPARRSEEEPRRAA